MNPCPPLMCHQGDQFSAVYQFSIERSRVLLLILRSLYPLCELVEGSVLSVYSIFIPFTRLEPESYSQNQKRAQ